MRKTREVLRLYFELKLGQRQIARSANVSQSTVHDYLERFRAARLSWPLSPEMSEAELEGALFPNDSGSSEPEPPKALPEFAHIQEELQRHRHVTRRLLWEEYRAAHPDGYGYSRFCYHYQRWKRERDLVLRQEHRPGEKLFVDWAGATIPVYDPRQVKLIRRRCSWLCSAPATTPMPKPTRTSNWPPGSAPMCALSNFLEAVRS
jgi:hypothetical protein